MYSDIVIIGGGAAGLIAAYAAASAGVGLSVTVLEKMPRTARKILVTGKGRCNFSNIKDWNAFSAHIRTDKSFVRPAFYSFNPEKVLDFMESHGMATVVERGDRAFPESHRAMDVADTLLRAAVEAGARVLTNAEVKCIEKIEKPAQGRIAVGENPWEQVPGADASLAVSRAYAAGTGGNEAADGAAGGLSGRDAGIEDAAVFRIKTANGKEHTCLKLIIATGGLSYPATGSTGDGYGWARQFGHKVTALFPSLTALVPEGYKIRNETRRLDVSATLQNGKPDRPVASMVNTLKGHMDRSLPLSDFGRKLCGVQLRNVGVTLYVNKNELQSEFGDLDFTDGGIEGPVGFELSRDAVKALVNGNRVSLEIDLKRGVPENELLARVESLWTSIQADPRSAAMAVKERLRVLLGKLMPWDLIPGFCLCNKDIITGEGRSAKVHIKTIARALQHWLFNIAGFVGYERCVITAGGVDTSEILPKTMESRLVPGLYFCGEVLDMDSDTGGYNLQTAFSSGFLAGKSAAKQAVTKMSLHAGSI